MTKIRGGVVQGPGIKFMTLSGTINKKEADLIDDMHDCTHLIYFCECDTAAGLITFTEDDVRPITWAGSLHSLRRDDIPNVGLNEKMLTIIYTAAGNDLVVDMGTDGTGTFNLTTLDAVGEFWDGFFIVRPDSLYSHGYITRNATPTV